MSERTLEQALFYADVIKQGGHDRCRMCDDPRDESERLHSERYIDQLQAAAFCVLLADEVKRLRAINTCCPRCHEPLGAPINEFGDYAACSSCGYGSKEDAKISALKERVVDAAIAERKSDFSFAKDVGTAPPYSALTVAVDGLIAAREKVAESNRSQNAE